MADKTQQKHNFQNPLNNNNIVMSPSMSLASINHNYASPRNNLLDQTSDNYRNIKDNNYNEGKSKDFNQKNKKVKLGSNNSISPLTSPQSQTKLDKKQSQKYLHVQQQLAEESNNNNNNNIEQSQQLKGGRSKLLLSLNNSNNINGDLNMSGNGLNTPNSQIRKSQDNGKTSLIKSIFKNNSNLINNKVQGRQSTKNNNGELISKSPVHLSELEKTFRKHFQRCQQLAKDQKIRNIMREIILDTEARRKVNLKQRHLIILNDNAMYIKKKIINRTLGQYIECCWGSIDKCLANMCGSQPFHPFNNWNFGMEIIENIVIIFDLYLYTLFCFYDFFMQELFFYVGIVSCIIFLLGTFLRINTAYFEQGFVVYDRARIIKQYRNNLFLYDFVGFIGMVYQIIINGNDQITKILCFLLILKYRIYLSNISKIEEKLNFNGTMLYVWRLSKLLCSILALCHFVGTSYFFLAFCEKLYLDTERTWVDNIPGLWDNTPYAQYIESYYWALATITLIGTKGYTTIETAYTIVVLGVTVGVFATILSQVSIVHEEMERKSKDLKRDKDILNAFFQLHSISNDLQGQLQNYLKYTYEGHKEKQANLQFEELMENKYPEGLQQIVRIERYSKEIKKFSLLINHFSPKSIDSITHVVQEEYFMPNQVIMQQQVYQQPKLFLILAGEAEVYQETGDEKQNILITLKKGQFFGYNTFFTNSIPYYSVRSKHDSFTTCLQITRDQFIDIINKNGNETDKQVFHEIKDQMNIRGYSQLLQEKCYICGKLQHEESLCNLINYAPKKINLFGKFNFSVDQERDDSFIRTRPIGRFHNLAHIHDLQEREQMILASPENRKFLKVIQEHQKKLEEDIEDDEDSYITSSDEDSYIDLESPNLMQNSNHYNSQAQTGANSTLKSKKTIIPEVDNSQMSSDKSPSQSSQQLNNNYNNSNAWEHNNITNNPKIIEHGPNINNNNNNGIYHQSSQKAFSKGKSQFSPKSQDRMNNFFEQNHVIIEQDNDNNSKNTSDFNIRQQMQDNNNNNNLGKQEKSPTNLKQSNNNTPQQNNKNPGSPRSVHTFTKTRSFKTTSQQFGTLNNLEKIHLDTEDECNINEFEEYQQMDSARQNKQFLMNISKNQPIPFSNKHTSQSQNQNQSQLYGSDLKLQQQQSQISQQRKRSYYNQFSNLSNRNNTNNNTNVSKKRNTPNYKSMNSSINGKNFMKNSTAKTLKSDLLSMNTLLPGNNNKMIKKSPTMRKNSFTMHRRKSNAQESLQFHQQMIQQQHLAPQQGKGKKMSQFLSGSQLEGPNDNLIMMMLREKHQQDLEFQQELLNQKIFKREDDFDLDKRMERHEFFIDFDKIQDHEKYFVHNNYKVVILDFRKYMLEKFRNQQKRKFMMQKKIAKVIMINHLVKKKNSKLEKSLKLNNSKMMLSESAQQMISSNAMKSKRQQSNNNNNKIKK